MTNETAFIDVDAKGNVKIEGGFIFHPGIFVNAETDEIPKGIHITGNIIYAKIPSKWDVLGWMIMRRKIMRWMRG